MTPELLQLAFRCNVCGGGCAARAAQLERETPSCGHCGSTLRFRAIVHALSLELHGRSLALPEFPARPDLAGLGMSDWEGYAAPLAACTGYRNTFFHQEPRLDILSPPPEWRGRFDFIVSSDVLEHVPPPVERAFLNLRALLKPGGLLVLTVPYGLQDETLEHFPELHEFRVTQRAGRPVLENTTRDGVRQEFDELVFHGGPGATLEMRVFSLAALRRLLASAGFGDVTVRGDDALAHGIRWGDAWSLPLTARAR